MFQWKWSVFHFTADQRNGTNRVPPRGTMLDQGGLSLEIKCQTLGFDTDHCFDTF